MTSLYLEIPQKVPTNVSLGFRCPCKMLAVCLWDLRTTVKYPLPWQQDLASLVLVSLIQVHICKV